MRGQTPKKISQLRRRRRMLGRKLLPKLKRVLQAGRIAKPVRTSHQWTVTPISRVDGSLVTTVTSATSAVSTHAAERRGAAIAMGECRAPNIHRGFKESWLNSSELDQELQDKDLSRSDRQQKKRCAAASATPPVQPAFKEGRSPSKQNGGSNDDEQDGYEDAVASLEDLSSEAEDVSDECSCTVSDESGSALMSDELNEQQPRHEDRRAGRPIESSSEEGMDEEDGQTLADAGDLFRVFMAAGRMLVLVQPPAGLRIVGRAQLRILHGMVDVEGLLLVCSDSVRGRPSATVVQSGFPYGPVHVQPMPFGPPSRTAMPLRRALGKLGLDDGWAQLRPLLARQSVVILLEKVPGGEWPVDVRTTALLRGSFRTLGFRPTMDETASISLRHPWRAEARSLAKHFLCALDSPEGRVTVPRILVCGRQNSGKSSVLRLFVNTFLNLCREVLYLDCDPGQCEFTPPATVSLTRVTGPLMGPPFTHVRTPEKSYFLGHVSPASQPDAYCESVRALIEHAHKVAPRTPLFVNTMGWISGLGLSLLVDVIRWSRPTDVVQLLADESTTDLPLLDNDRLESACGWLTSREGGDRCPPLADVTYHPLPGSTCRGRSWARVKREAMVLAYMGRRVGNGLCRPLPKVHYWLWNTVPMRVPWSAVAVHDCDNAVPKKELLHSLRGSVVGLCVVPTHKLLETENPSYPKFIDSCGPYECLGYGLVRAIDPVECLFYIASPEPQERLAKVNALVRGDLHLPESLLTSQTQLLQCGWAPHVSRLSCGLGRQGSGVAEDAANDAYC